MKTFKLVVLLATFFLAGCQKEEMTGPQAVDTATETGFLRSIKTVGNTVATKAVAVTEKVWNPGDTIRIKFLPGGSYSPELENQVKQYAAEWLEYANLYFEYVGTEQDADVKIGFKLDNRKLAWSTIGTDCKAIPQNEASLNLVLNGTENASVIKGEILRGFGHVLGLGFEHKNPYSPVEFSDMATMYYQMFCNLSATDIQELLPYYTTDQTNHTMYDPLSIMVLEIPSMIVSDPSYATTYNRELSEMDKNFIDSLYPTTQYLIATMTTEKNNINFVVDHTKNISIDWGDGTTTVNVFTHEYADAVAEHTITFYGTSTSLKKFEAANNKLKTLDISNNYALDTLITNNNNLTELNVLNDTSLTLIYCYFNQLTHLNVSTNTNLLRLSCFDNLFQTIDVRNLPKLNSFGVGGSSITSIDVTQNTNLEHFDCFDSQINHIDVTNNNKLEIFSCDNNTKLTEIDVSQNPNLQIFDCSNTAITALNLKNNHKITSLYYSNTSISQIDWGDVKDIEFLAVNAQTINTINFRELTKLKSLNCSNILISNLDLSANTALETLWCENCQLPSLDLHNNTKLGFVYCTGNLFEKSEAAMNEFVENLPIVNDGYISININPSFDISITTKLTDKGWWF